MRRPYHGGQNAREWRRKVAAVARRQRESVFTYKFRLDTQAGDMDFDAAAHAYDITEGIAKGSLIGLVCAVHLSGFRLFSKRTETRQFLSRSRYPAEEFAEALRTHAGIENRDVTIQSIENVFGQPPRARDGIAPPWSSEALAAGMFKAWNRRSPGNTDHDHPELTLARGIANEVTRRFAGWKETSDDVAGVLSCVDRYLGTVGPSFPRLADMSPATAAGPESCTFAYDPESPFIDMAGNEEIWLHQAVAVCAGRLLRDAPGSDPSSSRFAAKLKDALVTRQNNGISWLFGKGLRYLRKTDAQGIAQDLSVPSSDMQRIQQLKEFADAISPNPFFDTDGYAEFRGSVGGKIASWVSNYWKRIDVLRALHSDPPNLSIPGTLRHKENAALFSGQHTDATGLEALSSRLPERIKEAGEALAILAGHGIPGPKEIAVLERVAGDIAELVGQINMLANRVEQEVEHAEEEGRKDILESTLKTLKRGLRELKEPPKLNRISGGTDDAASEVRRLQDDLNTVVQERRDHFRRLSTWAGEDHASLDPLCVMVERERRLLEDRGRDAARAEEQVLRRLLHRVVQVSRRLSPETAQRIHDAVAPLFPNGKEANRYLYNRQGAIYRHPFSTSRHHEYDIDIDRARRTDWLAWLDGYADEIRRQPDKHANPALLRDLLAIEEFVFTRRLDGLPDRIPGRLARPRLQDGVVDVPPLLAVQLDSDEVSRDVAIRAFNLFNSAINGLSFRAFRDSFIVRVKFQRLDHEELFYAPKNRAWQPPGDYASAKGRIAKGVALPPVAHDDTGAVLPQETTRSLSQENFPEGSHELLRQAPHDWFVEMDLRRGKASDRAGLPVKKNAGGLKRWRPLKRPAFRLVGPPSFKTWLDRALVDPDVKLGDYTLILDREFRQSLTIEDGEIRLAAKPVSVKSEIAVPVVDVRSHAKAAGHILFDNVVAIDLGEKRVGFAVFSLVDLLERGVLDPVVGEDRKPLVGTVAVPAFRRLMAAVRRHRRSRQPNQKVGQTYSKALMQFRENVIGDVCNRIDTLCERFRGFPILESSVGNFEAGGRQLEMIYGSVLRRYTFSKVEAHKAARSQYWFRAEWWDHPYVHVRDWNEDRREYSGQPKPLTVFPGSQVNPAGTSQTCHRCRRNALAALRNTQGVHVGDDGKVVLGDGVLRLFESTHYPTAELKGFRRRKERPRINVPVRKGQRPLRDIEGIVRRNMRQAPLSVMSPDTTQARFVCVYEDCGFEGHADENAAINIGRRFLERIDTDRSRDARQGLTSARK